VTSIEPRTGRGRDFALEWPKVEGRSHRERAKQVKEDLGPLDFVTGQLLAVDGG
jgi:hypothetical protein